MKNEITVTTSRGTKINVVSGLRLSENINLDGHVTTVDCCEKIFEVKINDKHWDARELSTRGYPRTIKGNNVLASLGRCYLTDADVVSAIQNLVAETELHPSWVAKQELIEKNRKESADYDKHYAAVDQMMRMGE